MNILDLFNTSRLKLNTPNGIKPQTYDQTVVAARNVKFPPNIAPGAIPGGYIKTVGTGVPPGNRNPVLETTYMVTEPVEDFLMAENDDNLITNEEIV